MSLYLKLCGAKLQKKMYMSKKNRFFLHIGYIFYVISRIKVPSKYYFFLDCANIGCKKYIFLYLTTKIVQFCMLEICETLFRIS